MNLLFYMKEDELSISNKAKLRLDINRTLLAICFTLFTFIVAISPSLLKDNILIALQLTLAIPLLTSSLFSRSKITYAKNKKVWDRYGFITFLIAYSFLINIVGIFLSTITTIEIGLTFFGINIFLALIYSVIDVSEDKNKLKSRIIKDLSFILLIIFLGILPSLGFY